jgi:c(7)-type cytochrome triheme protein
MKKFLILALTLLLAAAFIGSALAVPPGKTVEFTGSKMGKVIFDGKKHADAGMKCNDCHPKIFKMKKGSAKITMAEHKPGVSCGTCHNGTKAFAQQGNCAKCHKK